MILHTAVMVRGGGTLVRMMVLVKVEPGTWLVTVLVKNSDLVTVFAGGVLVDVIVLVALTVQRIVRVDT